MSNCIYTNKDYKIYRAGGGFIVHNKHKPFKDAHTHCNNFGLCKIMIYTCIEGHLPSRSKHLEKNYHFIESLCRIATNKHKKEFEAMLGYLKEPDNYNVIQIEVYVNGKSEIVEKIQKKSITHIG